MRRIRSYVRRESRLTRAQARAIEQFWPRYGLKDGERFDPPSVFGRAAPLTLEIGFGDGDNLLTLARQFPEEDFLGIDVYQPGMGVLLSCLGREGIGNVRLYASDASDVLATLMPQSVLTRVLIFFPDPWPKRRHHKRRLIQPAFLTQVARALRPSGQLHLATDDENYAGFMKACLESDSCYLVRSVRVDRSSPFRRATRFERRGRRLGHAIYDIEAIRVTDCKEQSLDHWAAEFV
ncbi:MAG: tRNA (guanosine(46)-N7)-methyltransferase TrmB [Gammaproteobacteria bacterium]